MGEWVKVWGHALEVIKAWTAMGDSLDEETSSVKTKNLYGSKNREIQWYGSTWVRSKFFWFTLLKQD